MTHKTAFAKIINEYEQAQDNAAFQLENRKAKVYAQIPAVAEIDQKLAKIGASLPRLALAGDTQGIAQARDLSNQLKAERGALLKATVGEDYLTITHRCSHCQDTGYIQTAMGRAASRCTCLTQRLIEEYYALSNMKEVLKYENFDNFDFRLFSQDVNPSTGLSPGTNMENVYRLATKFVENFDGEFANLFLYGETGLGKTFICHCIAKDLLDRGKTVLYLTAPRLCKVLEEYRFKREKTTEETENMLSAIDEVDLLILDDLGAEMGTIVTAAALFDIINQRLLLRKHTVISTNLSPGQLPNQYSDRLASRFAGNYQMIKFFGEDIRLKKKYGSVRI